MRSTTAAVWLGLALSACGGESSKPAAEPGATAVPAAPAAEPKAPAAPESDLATTERSGLPEDPVAAKAASEQWDKHLEHEDEERQMWFDHNRVAEHRAVVKLFTTARASYDRARNAAALEQARAAMPAKLAELQSRITEIDHWGNMSRLLPDYAALSALLGAEYADAKLASFKGD